MEHTKEITMTMEHAEVFCADDYPGLLTEIADIAAKTKHICLPQKGAIIVSYLKDRSISKHWFREYQALVLLIMSGTLTISFTEVLLRSCRNNIKLRKGIEDYITTALR